MLCVDVLPPKLMLQMSFAPDPQQQPPQWSGSEKLALLTTILKDLDPDPTGTLIHLIQQRGRPRWNEIPLPEGRSLNSCVLVFEEMLRRSSSSSISHPGYAMTPMVHSTVQQLGPQSALAPRKRSHNELESQSQAQRMLQPKPPRSVDSPLLSATPVTNGESFTFVPRASPIAVAVPKATPKKRGRPNKEELDRRRAEAEARGEVYPNPTRKRPRQSEVKSEASPATSSMLREGPQRSFSAQTPQRQSPEVPERSSSGKRRRQKQRDKDSGALIADEDDSSVIDIPKEAQSPSERLLMKGASSSRSPAASRDAQPSDAPESATGHEHPLEQAGSSDQ